MTASGILTTNVDPAIQLCLMLSNAFENDGGQINSYSSIDVLHNLHKTEFKKKLTQELLKLMKRIGESCKDRQILIPLSGGYDSRLIASGLKKIGVNNVVCFSYGQKR